MFEPAASSNSLNSASYPTYFLNSSKTIQQSFLPFTHKNSFKNSVSNKPFQREKKFYNRKSKTVNVWIPSLYSQLQNYFHTLENVEISPPSKKNYKCNICTYNKKIVTLIITKATNLENLSKGSLSNFGKFFIFVNLSAVREIILLDIPIPILSNNNNFKFYHDFEEKK